ncbi:MAG: hypothetical protein LBG43_11690 [Treponema sp.]|nr:hypothetical protein [Treponema sp.]
MREYSMVSGILLVESLPSRARLERVHLRSREEEPLRSHGDLLAAKHTSLLCEFFLAFTGMILIVCAGRQLPDRPLKNRAAIRLQMI